MLFRSKDSKRLYVREVILQILTEQGRPMSTSELLAEARQRMDVVPGSMPANPRPPIVKLAPGVWGLAERDLPSASRRSVSPATQ